MIHKITCLQCDSIFDFDASPSHASRRKYCSHSCSNRARSSNLDISKKEYQILYKNKPENKERGRNLRNKANHLRISKMGESLKIEMIKRASARSKIKGIECSIVPDDFDIPEFCPIFGFKLEIAFGKKGGNYNSPSLDRIDPSLGYIKGNIMVISKRANSIKSDASFLEIEKLYIFLKNNQEIGLTLKDLQAGKMIK